MAFKPEKYQSTPIDVIHAQNILEKLDQTPLFKRKLEELKDTYNLPVDNQLRLKTNDPRDENYVNKLERQFAKAEENKSLAELMELAKTIASHSLLGNRLIVVRTSKFDDYTNGIDELIIDLATNTVVGAIDSTTASEEEKKKVTSKNEFGGARVKYGLEVKNEDIVSGQNKNLPVLLLRFGRQEVLSMASAIEKNNEETLNRFGIILKRRLIVHCEELMQMTKSEHIKSQLENIKKIFQEELESQERLYSK